jgi:hypothetical protein
VHINITFVSRVLSGTTISRVVHNNTFTVVLLHFTKSQYIFKPLFQFLTLRAVYLLTVGVSGQTDIRTELQRLLQAHRKLCTSQRLLFCVL